MKHPDRIALEGISEEPAGFRFEVPFTVRLLDREPLLEISPVRLEGEVSRIEGGFTLDARCVFEGKLECSRCLAAYPFSVDEPFSLFLCPREGAAAEARALGKDEADVTFFDGDEVAVAPIAEERVQMAIPMKPLCREDCLGLCPKCGTDRNLDACGCGTEIEDPRWAALRVFSDARKSQKV